MNATLREKEEQLFEFELERNKAKDALSERENEKKLLEKIEMAKNHKMEVSAIRMDYNMNV